MPEKQIPELQFLVSQDWFDAAREADLETEAGLREALSNLRSSSKGKFASMLSGALSSYAKANDGQLPADTSQLIPYFDTPVDHALLRRYEMLQEGRLDNARGKWLVTERAPVDNEYDTRYYISTSGSQGSDVEAYSPESPMAQKYPSLAK